MGILAETLLLILVGFMSPARAVTFPVMPVSSVYVEMTDGTAYGRIFIKLRENQRPPPFMEGRTGLPDRFAYIHLTDNERFRTVGRLNFLLNNGGREQALSGPKKAYVRVGFDKYFTTARFENFHLEIPNFNRTNHIFVTMPRGPIFSAMLIQLNEQIEDFDVPIPLLCKFTGNEPWTEDPDVRKRYPAI